MNEYVFNKESFFAESNHLYRRYPSDVSIMEHKLDQFLSDNPQASSFAKKAYLYQVAAQFADVELFASCPFYFELNTGRERNSVTSTFPPQPGIGCWLMKQFPDFVREFSQWSRYYEDNGLVISSSFTDTAHHYANIENVIRYGFLGICDHAAANLQKAKKANDTHGIDFLENLIIVCDCVMKIGERFAQKAEKLSEQESDNTKRRNYQRIAETAKRVPANRPETFYEALCTIIFTREICNALDGVGFAVIGHIDRLLYPFYLNDIKNKRINGNEARAYIDCFLSMTDSRWDLSVELPGGTNADVVIGGCDENGLLVYNDVTRMILESYITHGFANPKLQARVTSQHPQAYFDLLARIAGMGMNVLSIFNDDVIIQAQYKRGKSIEDSRLYLAGGCQEITLSNEVNCRAYAYLNLAQMLQPSLFPEKWERVYSAENIKFAPAWEADTFEEFYHLFLANFKLQVQAFEARFNYFGNFWKTINPCLLFSATMIECIDNKKDVSEGGAKYNTDCFAVCGIGTLIDSLYAIYMAVYSKHAFSMEQLKNALAHNYSDEELLRQYMLHKVPKFCKSDDVTEFGGRVMKDLSACLNGSLNCRGGFFEASLFAFYSYDWFKNNAEATPDGRRKGTRLSRGTNPSESTEGIDVATLLHSIKYLDFTAYPGAAVLYMDLPLTIRRPQMNVFSDIIRVFIENKGSVMDFNVVNKELLQQAQRDPENHRNIVVRVCGYSALFHSLEQQMQNEIIERVQR